jgi:hypothetical protein
VATEIEELVDETIGVTVAPEARITDPPGAVIVPEFVTDEPTRVTLPPVPTVIVPALDTGPVCVPHPEDEPNAITPVAETEDPCPNISPLASMNSRMPFDFTVPSIEAGDVPPIMFRDTEDAPGVWYVTDCPAFT